MTVNEANMRKAAAEGFINATDLADYLVRKGLPFRSAYKIAGQIVAECIDAGRTLESLPLERYRERSELFEADLYEAISLENCVARRAAGGGPAPESIERQLEYLRELIS
jgi:argininosuccinate lyase